MELHKNSPKRVIFPGAVYYIVIKTQDNYPYFKEEIFCDLFMENLRLCKQLKGFKLYGFSIIYDHVNLLIRPNEHFNISQAIKSLKENTSRDINVTMGYTFEICAPNVGDTPTCRLRLGEQSALSRLRGWILQYSGQNLDKKYPPKDIRDYKIAFNEKFGKEIPHPKFKWQQSFWDHFIRFHDNIVRQEKDWDYHYNYTVYNHIKHGLPENWKYTSLNYPELIDSIDN